MANPGVIKKRLFGKEALIVGLTLIIGAYFVLQFAKNWNIETDALMGQPAPEIEYRTEDGKPMSVTKHKGTTVLLNFWASWCAPCMEEMPSLVALENHFASQGLILLAMNIEEAPGEVITGKMGGTKMPHNLIFNFSKEFLRPYDVKTVPLSILIDKKGIVRKVYTGPIDWMRLENIREIESILKD